MVRRRMAKRMVTLSDSVVEKLDDLAEQVDTDRSDVIQTILEDVVDDEAKLNEIFGEEEDEEEEEESD